ncbi:MAG TPA: hypothetical protein VJ770_24065 [Stellaceae bacterium]|nr:hypothetical protein [Stellaceae bacterium]
MLLPALLPVIRNFPPERLPITAAAVNLGFFGAAAGPLLGGVVAAAHAWRWFHAGFAGLGVWYWRRRSSPCPITGACWRHCAARPAAPNRPRCRGGRGADFSMR